MATDLVVQHSRRRSDAPVGNPVHGGVRAAAAVVRSALVAPTRNGRIMLLAASWTKHITYKHALNKIDLDDFPPDSKSEVSRLRPCNF